MKFKGFFHHIFEAVIINFGRLPRYALETWGLSIITSLGLISFELSILPLALYYDLTTRKWRKMGLNVMGDDFIPMDQTPPFQKKCKTTDIPRGSFKWHSVANWRKETANLLKKGEWVKAYEALDNLRREVDLNKKQVPLCCHFLESVHRAIGLTINWSKEIQKASDREKFLRERCWFIYWQMVGYEGAIVLDFLSYSIRKRGCHILESDVPVIPVPKI